MDKTSDIHDIVEPEVTISLPLTFFDSGHALSLHVAVSSEDELLPPPAKKLLFIDDNCACE